jgi:hypothetical protein
VSEDEGRHETEQERLDRKWEDQLQELRVMQTGVQLMAGFLLTLPFTTAFPDLDTVQRAMFLTLMVIAATTTLLVITPVSVHRHLSGQQVKERVVATGQRALMAVVTGVALLVSGILTFIFDVVVGRVPAMCVGAAAAVVALTLLLAIPRRLSRD